MPVRDPVRGSVPLVGAPLLAQKMQKGARPVRQHYPVSGEEETAVSVDKLGHVLTSAKPSVELVHNSATVSLPFPASGWLLLIPAIVLKQRRMRRVEARAALVVVLDDESYSLGQTVARSASSCHHAWI